MLLGNACPVLWMDECNGSWAVERFLVFTLVCLFKVSRVGCAEIFSSLRDMHAVMSKSFTKKNFICQTLLH